jgi:endonuclease/exonuclease/phosphatase family metal-dependent hydrolase
VQFTSTHPLARGRVLVAAAMVLGLIVAFAAALAADAGAAKAKPRSTDVRVMTRNIYLGADLTDAVNATTPAEFVSANGQIFRDVDTNNFPVRARGLAREIRSKNPDLVGLQEVALWRSNATPSFAPAVGGPKTAFTVEYDFLDSLMDRLNQGRKRYRIVKVKKEFDFEAPADYDNDPSTGAATSGGELNGRLTMRDAIIAKVGAGVVTKRAKSGTFETLFTPVISGIPVEVTRGWVAVDATVRGSRIFRFVNTHLEAFGDPTIREAQAKELIKRGGPARSGLPVLLLGDLNSDDNTVSATNGDRLAYNALKRFGFRDRATENPMSCCLNTSILTDNFGAVSDFDHHIDHILTDTPRKVKRLASSVSGRAPVNGFWNSDHAGVFSKLRIFR